MNIPFFEQLASARNVLIAGAGGGFDVFCGLPLAIERFRDSLPETRPWSTIPC